MALVTETWVLAASWAPRPGVWSIACPFVWKVGMESVWGGILGCGGGPVLPQEPFEWRLEPGPVLCWVSSLPCSLLTSLHRPLTRLPICTRDLREGARALVLLP